MELFSNDDYYILKQDQHTLWISRDDCSLTPNTGDFDLDCQCHGVVYGLIGVFNTDKLILVAQNQFVGTLPGDNHVYKIQRILVINLKSNEQFTDNNLERCTRHSIDHSKVISSSHNEKTVQKTWNQIKSTASHVKYHGKYNQNETKEKYEKRIIDELYKMFNETNSFYYSLNGDLTNSLQRQHENKDQNIPLWKRIDDRFFWNKYMLSSLIECNSDEASLWILPVIQGFVQIENCFIEICTNTEEAYSSKDSNSNKMNPINYSMALISRRSRFRAGTRYKRRGVDENGKCANYVETEQIFQYGTHTVSFVMVRGSVPVYWSQQGHNYRPPPRLDRSEEETQIVFNKHFEEELQIYEKQIIVNLVEQTGREKVLGDAYLKHILNLDHSNLTYVSFDFHEYCRGMKFENVSILLESLKDIIKDVLYCWVDENGMICSQKGTFRLNCVDCLDRTNVIQTAIARTVMDTQFIRLGLLPPEGILPTNCRKTFQMLWANNGDVLSRQYAGTSALKSDFTRTGERRITGVMKDGYNSANRYYLNRFKDAYRQATIDMMQGDPVSDDLNSPENEIAIENPTLTDQEHHERIKLIIEDCKKMLISEDEIILGGWPLVDVESGDNLDNEMDTVLILTKDCYYVCEYDEHTDRITKYQKVLLEDLEKIEFGLEPNNFFSMKPKHNKYCIRLHYLVEGLSGYFHMFRSTNTRFFNNMAIPIINTEDEIESLKAICETFKIALSVRCLNVPFYEGKLDKRKSKLIHVKDNSIDARDFLSDDKSIQRNISDGQLLNLKTVGSKALTNVSTHFAKLKGKWSSGTRKMKPIKEPDFVDASVVFNVESSGEESSEEDIMSKLKNRKQIKISTISEISFSEQSFSSDVSEYSDTEDQEEDKNQEDRNSDKKNVGFIESCGILATSPPLTEANALYKSFKMKNTSFYDIDDFVLDAMKKASLRKLQQEVASKNLVKQSIESSSNPQIQINDEDSQSSETNFRKIKQIRRRIGKLSKSTEHFDGSEILTHFKTPLNSTSCMTLAKREFTQHMDEGIKDEQQMNSLTATTKMKVSQSETAIQDFSSGFCVNLPNPTTTPIVIKKDLVLSPLSRIAKGVQHFGMNFKSKTNVIHHSVEDTESNRLLNQRKSNSNTKIIEV